MGGVLDSHKIVSVNLSWKEYVDLIARVHDLEEELDTLKQQYDNLISEP